MIVPKKKRELQKKRSFEIRKEMDEAGIELFSKQYNLEFSWEDKI